jgi:hypothetical protein
MNDMNMALACAQDCLTRAGWNGDHGGCEGYTAAQLTKAIGYINEALGHLTRPPPASPGAVKGVSDAR